MGTAQPAYALMDQIPPPATHTIDAASIVAVIGTAAGWFPIAAAGAAFIWYCLQIFTWIEKRYRPRRRRWAEKRYRPRQRR